MICPSVDVATGDQGGGLRAADRFTGALFAHLIQIAAAEAVRFLFPLIVLGEHFSGGNQQLISGFEVDVAIGQHVSGDEAEVLVVDKASICAEAICARFW